MFPWFFLDHLSNPSIQSQANFPLATKSRCYLKLLNNSDNSGHMNTFWRWSWNFYVDHAWLFFSNIFSPLCDAHRGPKQHSEFFFSFKLAAWMIISNTCDIIHFLYCLSSRRSRRPGANPSCHWARGTVHFGQGLKYSETNNHSHSNLRAI